MNELLGRAYLEQAVEKAQKRNAARLTRDVKRGMVQARDEAVSFIVANPFAAVAGGVMLGIAIGAALPGSRPGKAVKALTAAAVDMAIAFGRDAWSARSDALRQSTEDERRKIDQGLENRRGCRKGRKILKHLNRG